MSALLTRDQLLDEILVECDICNHLYTKLPAGAENYRPTPGQRSTLELLRYLSTVGIATVHDVVNGKIFGTREVWDRSKAMAFEEFPAAMSRQKQEMRELFESIPDEQLATGTAQYVTGETMTIGHLLVKTALKWMVAYRMQLFLYAKACGASALNTVNNWVGMDMPTEEPAAA